jgi:hypothetical protein
LIKKANDEISKQLLGTSAVYILSPYQLQDIQITINSNTIFIQQYNVNIDKNTLLTDG